MKISKIQNQTFNGLHILPKARDVFAQAMNTTEYCDFFGKLCALSRRAEITVGGTNNPSRYEFIIEQKFIPACLCKILGKEPKFADIFVDLKETPVTKLPEIIKKAMQEAKIIK